MTAALTQPSVEDEIYGDLVETLFETRGSFAAALLGGCAPSVAAWIFLGDVACRDFALAIALAALYRAAVLLRYRAAPPVSRRRRARMWEKLYAIGAFAFVFAVGLATAALFEEHHADVYFLLALAVTMAGVGALAGRAAARPRIVLLQLLGLCGPLAFVALQDDDKRYALLTLILVLEIVSIRSVTAFWHEVLRTALRRRYDAVLQRRTLSLALNSMNQGLCMGDRDGAVTILNKRMRGLFDLAATPTPIALDELARAVARSAALSPGEAEAFARQWRALSRRPAEGGVLSLERRGRVLEFRCEPADAGRFVTIVEDVTERREAVGAIRHIAHHDALTGLPNRLRFQERLERELRDIILSERRVTVLCMDLDRFKEVNDMLGHSVGDLLLRAVAQNLRQCSPTPDSVARYGGDEFCIMLDSSHGGSEAERIAELVVAAMKRPHAIEGRSIVVGASVGMAQAPRDGVTVESLMKRADLAMYRAKALGGGNASWFSPDMEAELNSKRKLELELRDALAADDFVVHYQPIVDARDGRTTACEALLRWRHPKRGMVSPAEFIPVAEETGVIVALGEWVLRRACAQARDWPSDIRVAVNFSPKQFQQSNLVRVVARALADSGLAPERLEVEITENTLMIDTEDVAAKIEALDAMGVRLSLDDFGTGYSSLSYLNRFPVRKLKMDRSFVKTLLESRKTQAIVSAVALLARELDIEVVAEGVETQEQLACLATKNVFLIQGYLFSRPKPAEELCLAGATILERERVSSAA